MLVDNIEKKAPVETQQVDDKAKPADNTNEKGDVSADEVGGGDAESNVDEKGEEGKETVNPQKGETATKPTETQANNDTIKPQNRDQNHLEAEKRRAKEADDKARKEALEKAKLEGKVEGIKAATGGVNPFTNEKIEDDDDVEEYELMSELKSDGKDPIADYPSAIKAKRQSERKAASEKAKQDEESKQAMKKDLDDFQKENPSVDVGKLFNEPTFSDFANKSNLIGKVPLSTVYHLYQDHKKAVEVDEKEKKIRSDARRDSSDGSQTSDNVGSDYFTLDQLKAMSPQEIEKNASKVDKSYEHILHSGK